MFKSTVSNDKFQIRQLITFPLVSLIVVTSIYHLHLSVRQQASEAISVENDKVLK